MREVQLKDYQRLLPLKRCSDNRPNRSNTENDAGE